MVLLITAGNGSRQYPTILRKFLEKISKGDSIAKELIVNMTLNTLGPGKGLAVDMFLEHQIAITKSWLKEGQSLANVQKMSLLTPLFQQIRTKIRDELDIGTSSGHSKPDMAKFVKNAIDDLRSEKFLQDQGNPSKQQSKSKKQGPKAPTSSASTSASASASASTSTSTSKSESVWNNPFIEAGKKLKNFMIQQSENEMQETDFEEGTLVIREELSIQDLPDI